MPALLALALALALAGCESFPGPRSAADTAFVVPVVWLDSQAVLSTDTGFGYKLALENTRTGERKYFTVDSGDPYKIVRHWEEGEYLLKEYSSVGFADNWTSPLRVNQYLKLEKGKLTIFPCKVVIVLMESTRMIYNSTISVDFMELGKKDYDRIRGYLSGHYPKFKRWKS
jgi:hypothetical protein